MLSNHNLLKQEANCTINLLRTTLQNGGNGIIHHAGTMSLIHSTINSCAANGIYHNGGTIILGDEPGEWNMIYGNASNFYNNTMSQINAPYVWWGSVASSVIDASLYDNEEGKGMVEFEPWYNSACTTLYYYTLDAPSEIGICKLSSAIIRLSWNPVPLANTYKVLYANAPDATEWTVYEQSISATMLEIPITGEKAFYKVIAAR